VYSLDIETLISVLQNRRIQGFLEADLSTGGFSGPLRSGFIRVELQEGKIVSAFISDANGRILHRGQEALSKVGGVVLTWQLTETLLNSLDKNVRYDANFPGQHSSALNQTQSITHPLLSPVDRSFALNIGNFVPVRSQTISPERLRFLSRSVRSMYALVNGVNSIQRIADLLSLPVDLVYRELLVLQQQQIIAI